LFFHNKLLDVGDTALQDCAYSTFWEVVNLTKACVNTVLQKLKSPSPSTNASNIDLMLARKAAYDVVGAKNQLAIDMVQRNEMHEFKKYSLFNW